MCTTEREIHKDRAQSTCGQLMLSLEQPCFSIGAHPWQGGTELAATATTFLYLHTYPLNALLMSLQERIQ